MAIEKNNSKFSRMEGEFSVGSRDSMSSDEDELPMRGTALESEEEDEFDDADSGAGSDDFDLLELGEIGAEFSQVGDQTCNIPFELYDLLNLGDILSVDVWNDILTEEDRVGLSKYLPDMDQETYMQTLKELFTSSSFYFGSPMAKLFDMLKGGLCEPRVALYRQGLNFFQKHQHYHLLQKYQNSMVKSLFEIRDAFQNCRGYSIEERLRVLNIMRSQNSLLYEKMEEETESSDREEPAEGFWGKSSMERKIGQRMGRQSVYSPSPTLDFPSRGKPKGLEPTRYGKQNPRGILKVAGSKSPLTQETAGRFPSIQHGATYGMDFQKERKFSRGNALDKTGNVKLGKKQEFSRGDEYGNDSLLGLPISSSKNDLQGYGRNRNMNQMSEMKMLISKSSNKKSSNDYLGRKVKNPENVQQSAKPIRHDRVQEETFSVDRSSNYDAWNSGNKKGKIGRDSSDFKPSSYRISSPHMSDRVFYSDYRSNPFQEKFKGNSIQNGANRMFAKSEDTESDSSDQEEEEEDEEEEEEDVNPLRSNSGHSMEAYRSSYGKSTLDSKKPKFDMKDAYSSKKMVDFGEQLNKPAAKDYSSKEKQKSKMQNKTISRFLEDNHLPGSRKLNDYVEKKQAGKFGKNGQVRGESALKSERRHKGGGTGQDFSGHHSNFSCGYVVEEEDDLLETHETVDEDGLLNKSRRKGQRIREHESSDTPLLVCNSLTKKRKVNSLPLQQIDEPISSKKKGKKKMEVDVANSEPPATNIGVSNEELETKPQKKPFTLITPTVHTGFSFSIVHLLTAVRMAMITPQLEDAFQINKNELSQKVTEEQNRRQESINGGGELHSEKSDVPTLSVQEIVNRIRSNPGDPCILETQEPLQDLVRGVLKIFSSKSAPLGAKGWKPLVLYEKSTKSWSWIGPLSPSSDNETIEEETSPEFWGLPHKMLVKLVDSFANWLKSGQETLQQIGSLPAPPLNLMQFSIDEKERFKDLRAQKSLITINPSPEEVRAYFRKEEVLRYLVPDRAFSYTAYDGKKSIVAPLRRCGGKPTSKARDHFMLKRDRPPHVTILCIVRDAAARLPGSIGTRADVCTLMRDSQYIVEDVSDAQINQVVSGALDRLHYERDPCVQYDGERKLWVYLHRDREEEDFEDDGTSSTKKWKRQKKESVEPSDEGMVSVAFHGTGDQIGGGFDMTSDLNAEPSFMNDDDDDGKREDVLYDQDMRQNGDELVESAQGTFGQCQPMVWEGLGLDAMQDNNKLLCQENSTNEDFDDEAFGRGRTVGLLTTSLL